VLVAGLFNKSADFQIKRRTKRAIPCKYGAFQREVRFFSKFRSQNCYFSFWLDEKEPQKMISGNKAAENLIALCNGIVKIDGFTKNPKRKENAKAILRALEAI